MTRGPNGRLVPVLLDFLRRCERSSPEQYLALLVLNNISIPSENKRVSAYWILPNEREDKNACGGTLHLSSPFAAIN